MTTAPPPRRLAVRARLLPRVEGLRLAACNQGLSPGLDLSGDWCLVQPLEGGDVVLSVGDVVGHGLPATAAMLALRHALAGFAAAGHPPATVLRLLNDAVCARHPDVTATAVVARFRPSTGTVTWARAGHPPILLTDASGARPLPAPDGLLLGAFPDQRYDQRALRLPPGATLCLYTDGMVERPHGIEQGIAALRARLAAAPRAPEAALAALDFTDRRDDACVLLAQRTSPARPLGRALPFRSPFLS
ncbi:stage II sporulation protein E [Actinocorallia herbida]|uniref:Stage II sporulation protein E n=2 Tax=Actinocorallia herbida TaxID=58109 RepID=A0A3N1CZD6_9ACTN|nr:stage II sporulation protein E [Actinocorallia herbida]